MQPLNYDLQFTMISCKNTSIMHAAAAPSNLDAAITTGYRDMAKHNRTQWDSAICNHRRQTPSNYAHMNNRFPQHQPHATFMQPLQCVSQPWLPKHHLTAKGRNTQNTSNQHLHCELRRAQPAPTAHRMYLPSPATATLRGKTQGFVLRLSPQHKPHATFMQPLQCVSQPSFESTM